jgi:hypothetical protein
LGRLRELVEGGADVNEVEPGGDSILADILLDLCVDEVPQRYTVVRALLELGADPNVLGEERSSPMATPMIRMDTEMLRILLEAGADPNKAGGDLGSESFYDWAEFDYRFQAFAHDQLEVDRPTNADKKDEDSWLEFLDRIAKKHGYRRPDHLFLLRMYGAKSMAEMKGTDEGVDC